MAANDTAWMRRGGLFGKYVLALVGLVLFVLAVNGAIETWIIYQQTKANLVAAMAEKADATARRIDQAIGELERQISWVTRASVTTLDQRRADYALLLRQQSAVADLAYLDGDGREQVRLSRRETVAGGNADHARDPRFTQAVAKGVWYSPAEVRDGDPRMAIAVAHSGRNAGVTVAGIDLSFLTGLVTDAQGGKVGHAIVVDHKGVLLASSEQAARPGADLSALPQIAALIAGAGPLAEGRLQNGKAVLSAGRALPELGWSVVFEQPRTEALKPIGDLLWRAALLVVLGLVVATIAGTILARRMLVPIRALRAGASRFGAGDFAHRIEVETGDELEELAQQFNGMAGQLHESYSRLEAKVDERTRDLAQSVNELKVLEEVGRAVASSLDLAAVLATVAERALAITGADTVLIYGFDAAAGRFDLIEAKGAGPAQGTRDHLVVDQPASILHEAAARREPIAVADLTSLPDQPLKQPALQAGFHSVLVVPLADTTGVLGALVVMRKRSGAFSASVVGLMRTFAHQAVVAMRNARLFHEVDRKGRELASAHATVKSQADKLQEQTEELRDWNRSLEQRVARQLGEIERIRRLERFLAPQVAQLIASSDGHEALLASHRREVTVVFCDLRGFTAFTEATEPEEVMTILREYHKTLGELIFRYEGTLDRYAGDGVMILFNAPLKLPDHVARAVRMAVEMRDAMDVMTERWRNRGHALGFGIGIALGYATLGQIGFDRRLEYAAVGSVTNLASRLCDEAKAGQIVVSQRVYGMVEPWVEARPIADLDLKGFHRPVPATEVLRWRGDTETTAAGAPPSHPGSGRDPG